MQPYQFIFLSGILGNMSSISAAKLSARNRALLVLGLAVCLLGIAFFHAHLLCPHIVIGISVFFAVFWVLSKSRRYS